MAKDVSVAFLGEMSELKNSLNGMKGEISAWGDTIKGIGVAAFAGWVGKELIDGIQGLVAAGREWVAIAQEAAQVDVRLESVVNATGMAAGFTADELMRMASALRDVTTFGDETVKTAQTMLLRFKEIKGDEFKRTTALAADMATVLGGDLSSAADQLGRMLSNPERGMMLLERQGIKLTEMQKLGIKTMTEMGMTAHAQSVILTELEGIYGGASRAAAEAAGGGFMQINEAIGDVKESLGVGLLPLVESFTPLAKELALHARDIADEFAAWGETMKPLFESIMPSLTDELLAFAVTGEVAAKRFVRAFTSMRTDLELALLGTKKQLKELFGGSLLPEEIRRGFKLSLDVLKRESNNLSFGEEVGKGILEAQRRRSQRQTDAENALAASAPSGPTFNIPTLNELMGLGQNALNSPFAQELGKIGSNLAEDFADTFGGAAEGVGRGLLDMIDGKSQRDESFRASIEDAGSLFSRIQSAAASVEDRREEKKITLAQQTRDEAVKVPTKLDTLISVTRQVLTAVGKPQVAVLG